MSRSRIGALILIAVVGLGFTALVLSNRGLLTLPKSSDGQSTGEITTAALQLRDLRTFEELDGILEYGDSVQVSISSSGVLTYVAPEGAELRRGSVVARFYRSVTDLEVLAAEQQIASARAAVAQAELALQNLNAPATPAQIASANAAVAQAELALENISAPGTAAQIAAANAAVAQAELALENLNAPATPAQIASANAAVAQAELVLDNLNAPATPVQIASADAAVAQAKLALENLMAPATHAEIASADAAVAQAELAFENLSAPATPAQIASDDAAVAQAELALANLNVPATSAEIASADAAVAQSQSALVAAQGNGDTTWASRRIARKAFCDRATEIGSPDWIYRDPICPANDVPLTDGAIDTLQEMMFSNNLVVTMSNNLLNAHRSYRSAVASATAAADSLSSAQAQRAMLDDLPAEAELAQATEVLKSARAQRAALDETPTAGELAQATQALKSAREQRVALDGTPSAAELAPASAALKSAREQRAALDVPPSSAAIAQASQALRSAEEQRRVLLDSPPSTAELTQASEALRSAREQRDALDDPPTAAELASASEALKSAREQRAALDNPPGVAELAQASAALKSAQEQLAALDAAPTANQLAAARAALDSARASLDTALAVRNELVEGPSATVLMFGDLPAWREFRDGMSPAEDVEQLERNLVALEYGSQSLRVDTTFDTETAAAVRKMQVDLGLVATGQIAFGDVIFVQGTSVVESSSSSSSLGTAVSSGVTLVSLVPTHRVETRVAQNGDISITSESLQRVKTIIEVANKDLIDVGSEVKFELPDESVVPGIVREIGSVAVVPQGNQTGNPYLDVSVAIEGDTSLTEWTGAPVTVSITKKLADNVLAAPVTSLLALLGGGYALEVLEPESTRLVPVETGVYDEGWVEVSGSGLEVGTAVVVPR